MTAREDVCCPACPNPETAFRIKDVGMKFGSDLRDGSMTFRASRPVWEGVMMEHLRSSPDDEHQRLHDLCVTEVMAAGMSAEEAARNSVQAAVDGVRKAMFDATRRHL